MTITTVIVISVISILATLALLLFAAKRCWHRRRRWAIESHTPGNLSLGIGPLEQVESILQLDAEQLALWHPLKQQILNSQHDLAPYREALSSAADVEQAMNRWEDFVNDSLIKLRQLKPKLIEFYHSLSSQQQQKIDTLMSHRFGGNKRCGYHCCT